MGTRLIVDEQNELLEVRKRDFPEFPSAIRMMAMILSTIFHPVFMPLFTVWFLVYVHPYFFAGFSPFDKTKVMIQAFVMFTFFPVVTVLLLKTLKFIGSFQLRTQRDRIIPLVACGVWYFWIWYVWRNLPDYPKPAVQFTLAIWISVSLGLMANIIMKISLHAIAAGVAVTFMILLALPGNFIWFLCIHSFAGLRVGLHCPFYPIRSHRKRSIWRFVAGSRFHVDCLVSPA